MADNIAVEPSGNAKAVNVATDEISDIHYPIYKISYGADGLATQVSEANPLPVTMVEHLTTFTEEYTADASGDIAATVLFSPSATGHLGIQIIHIETDGGSGTISLDFATSGVKALRMYPSKNQRANSSGTHIEGANGEGLTFTATGIGNASKVFVAISYFEHNA